MKQEMARLLSFTLMLMFSLSARAQGVWYDEAPFSTAVVLVWQLSEYPEPGVPLKFPSGLVLAIWADGKIIKTSSTLDVGKSYVSSKLSTAQLKKINGLVSKNMNPQKDDAIPLHVPMQVVVLKQGKMRSRFVRLNKDRSSTIAMMLEELESLELNINASLPCEQVVPSHQKWCNQRQVD